MFFGRKKEAIADPKTASTALEPPVLEDMSEPLFEATSAIDLKGVIGTLKKATGKTSDANVPDSSAVATSVEGLLDCLAEQAETLRTTEAQPDVLTPLLLDSLGYEKGSPMMLAAEAVCSLVVNAPVNPSYHNAQHVTEVVLAAYCLGLREHLPKSRIAELVVAAVCHDVGHTGGKNSEPYELELASYYLVYPHLYQAGLDGDVIERIGQMIVSTDFANGVPQVREAYRATRDLPEDDANRLVTSQCELLIEADVLFSCFNESYNSKLSELLTAEWQLTESMSYDQRIGFLKMVAFISAASQKLALDQRRLNLIAELEKKKAKKEISP